MVKRIKARLRGVRDYVRYQTAVLSGRVGARFENHYAVWRSRRLQTIIEEYPPRFFAGKTLLEPGAGFGDIGAYFRRAGREGDVPGRPGKKRGGHPAALSVCGRRAA